MPTILSLRWTWTDTDGDVLVSTAHPEAGVTDPEDVTPLTTALRACSTAQIGTVGLLTTDTVSTSPPTPGPYDVRDLAVMQFRAEDGTYLRVTVPAPDPAVFGPDGETVDPIVPSVAALIDNVSDWLVAVSGSPVATFVRGWRMRISHGADD